MKRIVKERDFLVLKSDGEEIEDFFNIVICLTSITKRLIKRIKLKEIDKKELEIQKEILIQAIANISDILKIDTDDSDNKEKMEKKKFVEELIPVERYEFDVIPMLRFYEIKDNLNTIIKGYEDIGENISYEKTCNIATDLTRIENSMDNIEKTICNELKTNLIYKE